MSDENITVFILDPDNPPPMTAERRAMIARLDAIPDDEIDLSDMPEWDFELPPPKEDTRLRLDGDVVAWLSECRHGADWQANFVLRHEMLRSRHWAEIHRREAEAAAAQPQPVPEAAQPQPVPEAAEA